jgi:hypothetical protein
MKTDEGGDIITRPIVLVYFVTIILFTLWIAAASTFSTSEDSFDIWHGMREYLPVCCKISS